MSQELITRDNFADIIDKHEIVLVAFKTSWCAPCKVFAKIYEEVEAQYPDIIFATVDVEQEPKLAEELSIRTVPMLIICKKGTIVFAESGSLPKTVLVELIEQAKSLL